MTKPVDAPTSSQKDEISASPYYLHPSDHPHHVLTPMLLNGDNYERWAKLTRNNLQAKKKLGFIDGTLTKPSSNSPDYPRWLQTNSMLVGWIYASLDPHVQKSISIADDAKVMWESLKTRYSVGNASRVHQLKSDLVACRQNGQTAADYFGKLKVMWDDLDDYEPLLTCCCDKTTCSHMLRQIKRRDHERIHQFLMGLDAAQFGTTRTNILSRLSRDESITLDSIYSDIIAEERHLTVARSKEERVDAIGFAVQNGVNAIASVTRVNNTGPCTHCGRSNHNADTCFKLHGVPEWYTDKYGETASGRGRGRNSAPRGRGRGRGYSYRANNAQTSPSSSVPADFPDIPGVSKEAWSAIKNLLKPETSVSSEKLSGKTNCVDFLIDSGASHHMTGFLDLLTEIYDIPHSAVVLPNAKHTIATKEGTLILGANMKLTHVLFVPDLSCTLISVARLLRELHCFAMFTDKVCVIQDRISKTVIGIGEERNGVYHLQGTVQASANAVKRKSDKALWHMRLGHPSSKVLSSVLLNLDDFDSCTSDLKTICDVCVRAKQTRSSFPESFNKAEECFSLIHCDVWGPYKLASSCGAHYFLTIVDDHSRAVWTHLMLAKSEVGPILQKFIAMAFRQFNKQVKIVRSDNGTEFMSLKAYFAENGIIHQTSCVYTPQQNGRVERKHRHILNIARSLLFQVALPTSFWGESVLTAAYLINRTPTPILDGKTPYEILYSTSPAYDHMRVFGSLCFAKKQSARSDKFQERGRKGIFVGYPHGQKGWRIYDIESHEFFVSRDVIFQEDVFPFAEKKNITPESNSFQGIQSSILAYDDDFHSSPIVETTTDSAPDLDTSDDSTSGTLITHTTPAPAPAPTPTPAPLRRSQRNRQESVRLKDYETYSAQCDLITPPTPVSSSDTGGKCAYPMANFVSCERFSEKHQHFLASISMFDPPNTYNQAVKEKEWRNAVTFEVDALEDQGTWDIVPLPHGVKPIGSKWVFHIKYNSDGTVERYKARLVALGNHQKEGVDFTETFAPVVKMQTVRLLLDVAAAKNWELHQMDVYNAFLHGDLKEDIYMKPPPGFKTTDPSHVCKLKKSIYGLKQAPRCWFEKLSVSLLKYGFVQSKKDYSLFTSIRGSTVLHIIVYVDDLVICGNDASVIAKFKTYLSQCFKMKDLGPLKYFLGIEVARNPEGIFLSQRKYCLDVIQECGLSGSRPVDTPLEQNHKLASSTSPLFSEPDKYRRLVGRLVYLTHTKPEISYAVNMLAQFMQKPLLDHWEAVVRLVRYLKGCPGQGILLSSSSDLQLKAFSDSDHAGCPLTRRSLTGYLVKLGTSPVSWKTKKQDKVSRSSAEAEYRAMAMTCQELMWVKEVLISLGITHDQPMQLFCDSQSALHIASNPVFHERTKHIESDCHFIRDELIAGNIIFSHISTTVQPADIFTKALGSQQFRFLRDKLGVCNLHAPT
ncbi:Integrase catalytic core [Arabidopsis suecica]|uniref:Integrase catalytic core n=1 Tax=Arabidopsis suecica TaxID=45249 RepID=A0A8T1YJZ8_ARASU|nr:Integrase catalytic core [Arabidopsis suecica]